MDKLVYLLKKYTLPKILADVKNKIKTIVSNLTKIMAYNTLLSLIQLFYHVA